MRSLLPSRYNPGGPPTKAHVVTNAELERIKLELEIRELKRPWFVRPANLISVLSLMFAVYQFQSAETKKDEANERVEEVNVKDEFLDEKQQRVSAAEKVLIEMSKEESPAPAQILNTGKILDVWAYGVSQSLVDQVRNYLVDQGNDVGYGGLLGSRPSWLALQPTVFYYSTVSASTAQQIADELQDLTGLKFLVARGAGLGVNEGAENVTFFVHLVE